MTPSAKAKFMLNVVQGVCNKRRVPLNTIPPTVSVELLRMRIAHEITNAQVVAVLNMVIDDAVLP